MSTNEIVARIMYEVDEIKRTFPLRDIAILMSWKLYLRIQPNMTVRLVNGCVVSPITLFGVPIETTNGNGECWYVGIKGMKPKEET